LKPHYQQLGLAACVVLVSGGLVTCRQRSDTLDTELFPIAAAIRSDSPALQTSGDTRPDAVPEYLTPVPQTDENCLGCHADVEDLKVLATEAEPAEAVSSGEG
jgi:hypothetical protein